MNTLYTVPAPKLGSQGGRVAKVDEWVVEEGGVGALRLWPVERAEAAAFHF